MGNLHKAGHISTLPWKWDIPFPQISRIYHWIG